MSEHSFLAAPLRLLPWILLTVQAFPARAAEPTSIPWKVIPVATVDVGSPFAVDGEGRTLAYIRKGLRIHEIGSGREQVIQAGSPAVLAWSPDGQRLGAAFVAADGTTLHLFSRKGEPLGKTHVEGCVTSLAWRSEKELLAFAIQTFRFRFGTRITETLARWDGLKVPSLMPLEDTTVMPSRMAQWQHSLQDTLTFTLSPLGDEILYTRFNAPPALPPSLKVILRHLDSAKGRQLAEVSMEGGHGLFSGDGRFILYGDGVERCFKSSPWDGQAPQTIPEAGRCLAVSPSGRTVLVDGQIYREGVKAGSFGFGVRGQFAVRSGALFLEKEGRLSQVMGMPTEPWRPLNAAAADRLRQRRKWLAEALITPADYAKENLP